MKNFPGRLHLVCSLALALACEGFSTHRDQYFQRRRSVLADPAGLAVVAEKGTTSHSPGFWGSSMTGIHMDAVQKQLLEEGA